MYYEVYIDSLFLLNFVMNLYLLMLVNRTAGRTATRLRLILGAAAGSICYVAPLLLSAAGCFQRTGKNGALVAAAAGMLLGLAGMILTVFRIRTAGAFFHLLKLLLLNTFLMGGMMLFLIRSVPFLRQELLKVGGILGMGGLMYLFVTFRQEQKEKKNRCCCTLVGEKGKLKVSALIDSGNSLVEPISGKPVSVIEKTLFGSLWREESPYRAIPYTSIGKRRGILQGYLLKELQIEVGGVVKTCKDVYVAVSENELSGADNLSGKDNAIKMILHPALFKE